MKILANDGISPSGIQLLEQNGFEVLTTKVAQSQLENYINEHSIDAVVVRSATQVRQELIEACPSIKLIGRAGVGMDNIDVDYALDHGLHVINTPNASASSVAELVFAHLFGMVRFLHKANREMPLEGDLRFKDLKREFGTGIELRGKTLGIVGLGRIGKEVAKIALGVGMKVVASDNEVVDTTINLEFFDGQSVQFPLATMPLEELLPEADFVSLHTPNQDEYIIGDAQFNLMKNGVGIINTARGGVLDEVALLQAIDSGKVNYAALDVFEKEPYSGKLKSLSNTILTPHVSGYAEEIRNLMENEAVENIIREFS